MQPTTLLVLLIFGSIGAWWGWRYANTAIYTGTAPRWRRRHGQDRREFRRVVKWKRNFWRLTVVGTWSFGGAVFGYLLLMFTPR